MSLDSLPYFILEEICDYVVLSQNQGENPQRSLWPFSSASRRCYSAAATILFRQIRVESSSIVSFAEDLKGWDKILTTGNHIRHVRELILMYPNDGNDNNEDYDAFYGAHLRLRPASVTLSKHWLVNTTTETDQEMWQTLSRLIGGMHGLRDFVFAIPYHLDRSVLNAIHTVGCRLHMHCFSLPSLYQPKSDPGDISPDDYALITSPSLYSIVLSTAIYDMRGLVDYHKEALLRMLAGTSPNLAHVWLRDRPLPGTLALQRAIRSPRPRWPGFFPRQEQKHEELSMGGLKTLVFPDTPMDRQDLASFSRATDFSKLACLSLTFKWYDARSYRRCCECLNEMLKMAETGQFASLEALSLHYCRGPSGGDHGEFLATLIKFFKTIRPLQSLYLTNHNFTPSETLSAAISRHTLTPGCRLYSEASTANQLSP
ncbi:hypothetical protein F5Y10DRAFT_273021 [Nemania abortiva]|nr:hypothetical protein F5Y10DRAFT_273021 [Nemania abortiva]